MPSKKVTSVLIIDASGSMGPKANEVSGGITQWINSIQENIHKNVKDTVIITQFSGPHTFTVLENSEDPSDINAIAVGQAYATGGMTALYDAIARTFDLVPKKQDGVNVTIITDGEENASSDYDSAAIKKLIEKKQSKKKPWQISFMGTTEKAVLDAQALGVNQRNTRRYANTRGGTVTAMAFASSNTALYRKEFADKEDKKADKND